MKKLFGTDGIRGEAGRFPLDKETLAKIGWSLARNFTETLGRSPRFIIGRDTRESGGWIEEAISLGLEAGDGVCASAEIITTPGVAFLTKALDLDAGIVISASHNPFQDNGIKVFLPSGQKLDRKTEMRIEADIHNGSEALITSDQPKINRSDSAKYQKAYTKYLSDGFNGLSLKNIKIVIDCANGAASLLAPDLFRNFGAETTVINNNPDGKNINRDCGSLHLGKLQAMVLAGKADFGVAFDGDADRALFVNEQGQIVDGDAVLWIMAQHLSASGQLNKDMIVATVMSNIGLEAALRTRNIKLIRTPVGDKHVLEELLKSGASVGGEQSGHIIFPEKSLVGDGMFTALYLLEALQIHQTTLSGMAAGFRRFPQILHNIPVREKIPFEEIPEIAAAAREVETELGDGGRLLLRYSGTENLARVMIEGESQSEIERLAGKLAGVIGKYLGVEE